MLRRFAWTAYSLMEQSMLAGRWERNTVVLFALEREAAPFRRAAHSLKNVSMHVTGVGCQRGRAAAEQILREWPQPSLVIAAGFCGALSPRLKVGDVVTSRILMVSRLVSDP